MIAPFVGQVAQILSCSLSSLLIGIVAFIRDLLRFVVMAVLAFVANVGGIGNPPIQIASLVSSLT